MNVIYATLEENPEWNDWANGNQLNDAPAESVVHLMVPGVDVPILSIECEGFVGRYSKQSHQEAIADTLREFFAQVQSHILGG